MLFRSTFVLFTCSVQHAAVNFPQYDQMSYIPNMPLAGYAPAPTSSVQDAQMSDYFKMLPPLDMAELQMNLGFMLGTIHYTELGSYDKHHFKDPRIQPHLARFHHELKRIGDEIEERNESRPAYSTLLPQGIPQSINI